MQHRLVAIDGEPKDLISKLRQPLLMRLSAAGPSFFERRGLRPGGSNR